MKYNKKLYPFTSRWVEIDGETIHYVDEGSGQIILVSHAPLGSSFMYREFIKDLSKNHRCIALDYPGFGLSTDDVKKRYSIESQSILIHKFIKYKKLSNIIAFGHDTGGPSIFKVAADHPDLFSALILTDTIIYPTTEYPRIHRMLGILGSAPIQHLNAWTNFLVRLTLSLGIRTRKLNTNEKKQYRDLFKSTSRRRRITELLFSLRQQSHIMESIRNAFAYQLNNIPTLLIYGEDDPVTKMGIPARIHRSQADAQLYLIKGAGHFPHEGQPLEMCRIIKQWMVQHDFANSQSNLSRSDLAISN